MMVNCPKCGFSQPKDQYCAKCGVDMIAFRPAEKPLVSRILGNTFVQLLLLIGLIATGFGYVRFQNQSQLATRIAELEDTESTRLLERPLAQADSASEAMPAVAEDQTESIDIASTNAPPATNTEPASTAMAASHPRPNSGSHGDSEARLLVAQNATAPKAPGDPANAARGPGASNGPEASAPPTNIRVVFAEIQKPLLSEIIAGAQDAGGYGNFNSGVVASLEAQMKSASDEIRNLEAETMQPLRINQMIPIYKGTVDDAIGQNIGVTLEIIPLPGSADDPGTRLSIKARRTFRDPRANPPIDQLAFPEDQYSIPRGGAVFLSGLLPKRQIQDDEARLYNTVDVLKILSLDSYRSGLSEFIVFIEPR